MQRSVIQRISLAIALIGSALIVGSRDALAAVPTDPVTPYAGTMSDGGVVLITVQYGSQTLASFDFGGPPPRGCQTGFSGPYPLTADGVQFGGLGRRSSGITNVNVIGYVDTVSFRTIAGLIMADGPSGSTCGNHRATWIATNGVVATPTSPLNPNAHYSGAVTLFESPTSIGTVSIRTAADGTLQSFTVSAMNEGCTYALDSGMLTTSLKFDGAGIQYRGTNGSMAAVMRQGGLVGVALMTAAGCPDLPAAWSVWAPASSPPSSTPTPPTSGSGRFLTTPTFGTGASASAVFSGGSIDALEAAAQSAGATGVWVQDAGGGFQLLVVGSPAFLKNAFIAKFIVGIAGPVAVTLVR